MNFTEEFLDAYRKIIEENLLLKQQLEEKNTTIEIKEENYRKYSLNYMKKYIKDIIFTEEEIDIIISIAKGETTYTTSNNQGRKKYKETIIKRFMGLYKELIYKLNNNIENITITIIDNKWVYRNFEIIFLLEKFVKNNNYKIKIILLNPLGIEIDYFNMDNKDFEDLIKEFNRPEGQGFRWTFNKFNIYKEEEPLTVPQKEPEEEPLTSVCINCIESILEDKSWAGIDIESFEEIVKFLDKSNNINLQDKYGMTPLMKACIDCPNLVNKIVKMGANLNLKENSHGKTALIIACEEQNIKAVELLIKAGADINIENNNGDTALTMLSKNLHDIVVKIKMIKLLNDAL